MKIIPLFISALLLSCMSYSQSLFEKLNGTETAYIFTCNQDTIAVTSQGIVSKGVKESKKSNEKTERTESFESNSSESNTDCDGNYGYGYGYGQGYGYGHGYGYGYGFGFQAYHLDIISINKIKTVTIPVTEVIPDHIEVQLFDKDNRNIVTLNPIKHPMMETIDNRGHTAFSINLNDLPIAFLNETKRIDIRKVKTRLYSEEELEEEKRTLKLKLEAEKNRLPFWIQTEPFKPFK